jgi:ubiquinone/menaquinone biosynthesis C-methylase UbiE
LNELGNNDLPADSHEIDFATTSWRQIFIDQAQFVLNKTFDSIIDVGCGNGDLMRTLQKDPHLRVSGIEHPRYQASRWHERLDVKYHDLSNK